MAKARTVVDTLLAEAGGKTRAERLRDMKSIMSVIANRARQLGVSLEDVVSVTSEFNAYGRKMPAGVEQYRDLAEQALTEVIEKGPINNATFYATPSTVDNLPSGLAKEDETAGHHFFSDPQNRAIRTTQGFLEPSEPGGETSLLAGYAPAERVSTVPSAFDSMFGGYAATPQTGFRREPASCRTKRRRRCLAVSSALIAQDTARRSGNLATASPAGLGTEKRRRQPRGRAHHSMKVSTCLCRAAPADTLLKPLRVVSSHMPAR